MQARQGDLEQNISDQGVSSWEINRGSISHNLSESSKPVDVSSRVWKLFLDSKCSSATVFFRLHLSARTYFRNPTPWSPGNVSTLSRKVSQLLDSFRPGSSSYSPFQNKTDENNNTNESDSTNELIEDTNVLQLTRPSAIRGRVGEEPDEDIANNTVEEPQHMVPENPESNALSREEENRRRLYLNLGRPRPFYRTTASENQHELGTAMPAKHRKKNRLLSLQECSRNKIVSAYGLKNIRKLLDDSGSIRLPEKIRNYLLTFPCHEFEEIGHDRPCKSASYNVQSLLDGQKYTAVFATSDVDRAVSNLWLEEGDWLMLRDPGVTEIFGIAVDPLTENIFYIIPEQGYNLESILNTTQDIVDIGDGVDRTRHEVADLVEEKVKSTLERLLECRKAYGPLKEENIFLFQGQVLLENRLLLKQNRGSANKYSWEEHQQNLKYLQCIKESVMRSKATEIN